MKVLLVNVDAKFNLAIRKLYRYFKERGDEPEMLDLNFPAYPHSKERLINDAGYDALYISNIFEINAYRVSTPQNVKTFYGGIGSRDPKRKLSAEVEKLQPWYFEDEDMSYGFTTRGCIRNCWFCKVPGHEGKLKEYMNIEDIVQHKSVCLLDNNLLASASAEHTLQWLAEKGIYADLTQGLDYRLITDENAELLSKVKHIGAYTFAFDDPKYKRSLEEKLPILKRHIPKNWGIRFYVYYHPKMEISGLIDRIEWCKKNYCLPYVMRDYACHLDANKEFFVDIAAWCNQINCFKKMTFEDFLHARHNKPLRIIKSLSLYNTNKERTNYV